MERIKKSNNTTLSIRTSRENIAELKKEAEENGLLLSNYCWDLIMKGRNETRTIGDSIGIIEVDEIYALAKDCEIRISEILSGGANNFSLELVSDLRNQIKDIAVRSKRIIVNRK